MRRFRPAPKIHFAFVCSEAQPYRSQSACLLLEPNDASGILAGYTIPAQRKNRSNEKYLGTWQFRFPNFIAVGDPRIKTDSLSLLQEFLRRFRISRYVNIATDVFRMSGLSRNAVDCFLCDPIHAP